MLTKYEEEEKKEKDFEIKEIKTEIDGNGLATYTINAGRYFEYRPTWYVDGNIPF